MLCYSSARRIAEAPFGGGGVVKKLSISTSAFASSVSATRSPLWTTGILVLWDTSFEIEVVFQILFWLSRKACQWFFF